MTTLGQRAPTTRQLNQKLKSPRKLAQAQLELAFRAVQLRPAPGMLRGFQDGSGCARCLECCTCISPPAALPSQSERRNHVCLAGFQGTMKCVELVRIRTGRAARARELMGDTLSPCRSGQVQKWAVPGRTKYKVNHTAYHFFRCC